MDCSSFSKKTVGLLLKIFTSAFNDSAFCLFWAGSYTFYIQVHCRLLFVIKFARWKWSIRDEHQRERWVGIVIISRLSTLVMRRFSLCSVSSSWWIDFTLTVDVIRALVRKKWFWFVSSFALWSDSAGADYSHLYQTAETLQLVFISNSWLIGKNNFFMLNIIILIFGTSQWLCVLAVH